MHKKNLEEVFFFELGVMDYEKAFEIQQYFHGKCTTENHPPVILSVEHPPVVTLGKNASQSHILDLKKLTQNGVKIHQADRGGQITAHMPGQLIYYFIFPVEPFGVKRFVFLLEESIISLLRDFSLDGYRDKENPGVFVAGQKICSLGIRIKDRFSYHGFSLNVRNSLEIFSSIVACGLPTCQMATIESLLGAPVDDIMVQSRLQSAVKQNFSLTDFCEKSFALKGK